MRNKRTWQALLVALVLTPLVMGSACNQANAFKTARPDMGAGVEIGPFPQAPKGAMGYHLYMADKANGNFERVSDTPVLGRGKVVIPHLKAGHEYFFRMTTVASNDAYKESAPSAVFSRKAINR